MKINEIENLLGLTRANIRFYEKEGLLTPERKENGYREYSDEDIAILKKIIIFRKLGISLPEIKEIINGTLEISVAINKNIEQLTKQIEELNGALEVSEIIKNDTSIDHCFNEEHYWELIQSKESEGEKFSDILKDYGEFEKNVFLSMWEGPFFLSIRDKIKKYGWKSVLIGLLILCVIRGLVQEFLWKNGGSFLEGFSYPFVLFGITTLITVPIYLLHKKYKDLEPEETPPSKHPFLKGFLKCLLLLAYFVFYLFGALVIAEDIFTLLQGNIIYTATFDLYILYYILGLYVFALFVYLYSKHGLFPDRVTGEDGFKCNLPLRKKHMISILSVSILILSFILSMLWYDCFTEDGLIVRRFFYTKTYTWEEIDYYYIDAHHDGTLGYSVVMQDGRASDCMGGIIGLANLPEEKYPDYDYDFVRYLSRKFTAQGVELKVDDWSKLYKDLKYDSWIELAEDIRDIAEE
ncbi:MAG: MerR family transcriptional regulator [Agathobacter sp.]|nr:MerR family transcriptional regulator [Agathobacter sp.]